MTTTTNNSSWFAPKLRAELDRSATSIRALARAWRPADPETARRSIIRYLQNGVVPGPATRAELAVALGVSASEFDPDDSEEDRALREAFELFVDLMGRIQARREVTA